ncbi:MAG: hypothetical protein ABI200_06485 [Gaiellales bacterium]
MPDALTRIRRSHALLGAALAACLSVLVAVWAPPTFAKTLTFNSATPSSTSAIDLGFDEPKQGISGKIKFRTTKSDRRAIKAARSQEDLRADADRNLNASTRAGQRIAAIEQLLVDVEGDEERLSRAIRSRAVEQYKQGDNASVSFMLSGTGFADILSRGQILTKQAKRDQRRIEEYELTLAKIDQYRQVLAELRDLTGEQSVRLRERADRLDDVLVAAKAGHDEAPAALPKGKKGGIDGTWYIMDGAFSAQLYLPISGGNYTGGTRTPARQATAAQIQRVLSDPRIVFSASGYNDVVTGQVDGRLLDALSLAAAQFNYVKITSLKRDHGVYTASGNVSAHSYGCAADIGTIGTTWIQPSSQTPGGEVEQAVRYFAGLQGDLAPHQVISLFNLGGSTLAMGDHGDHIHIGYSC